jgi:Na+-driven multidrug efflux pump
VLGQIVSAIVSILLNVKKNPEISIQLKGFRPNFKLIKQIYGIGIPSIIMSSIGSIMNYAMNRLLLGFTSTATAVFGVYFKLQSFVFMPVFGLSNGMIPVISYNYGAGKKERVIKAVKSSVVIALIIMTAGVIAFETVPGWMLSIFNPTPELLEIGIPALRIIATIFPIAAVGITMSTLFQAAGNGTYSLIQSVLRQLAALVPAAWLLSKISLGAVWLAFPIAEGISLVVTIVLFVRLYNKDIRHLGE